MMANNAGSVGTARGRGVNIQIVMDYHARDMLSFPSSSKYTIETQIDYCMSKKSRPNLYSNLIYEMGPDFLDIQ